MSEIITITENAQKAIAARLEKAPEGTIGLRLNVKPSGCSGNSYAMEYVSSKEDLSNDDQFENLYIAKTLSWMLFGMTIDYGMDELGNETFKFDNPNEKGRCGCGESFQI